MAGTELDKFSVMMVSNIALYTVQKKFNGTFAKQVQWEQDEIGQKISSGTILDS